MVTCWMDLGFRIQKTNLGLRIHTLKMPCLPIFKSKFAQKWTFGRKLKKLMSGKESTSSRYHVCQFSCKTGNSDFLGLNLPKNWSWGQSFKNISLNSESAPPVYHVCQFSVKQIWIFRPKFGKIAQLRAIFWFEYCWGCCRELGGGWNELGGGRWSWVEVDMRLVEVGARFSNTHI